MFRKTNKYFNYYCGLVDSVFPQWADLISTLNDIGVEVARPWELAAYIGCLTSTPILVRNKQDEAAMMVHGHDIAWCTKIHAAISESGMRLPDVEALLGLFNTRRNEYLNFVHYIFVPGHDCNDDAVGSALHMIANHLCETCNGREGPQVLPLIFYLAESASKRGEEPDFSAVMLKLYDISEAAYKASAFYGTK